MQSNLNTLVAGAFSFNVFLVTLDINKNTEWATFAQNDSFGCIDAQSLGKHHTKRTETISAPVRGWKLPHAFLSLEPLFSMTCDLWEGLRLLNGLFLESSALHRMTVSHKNWILASSSEPDLTHQPATRSGEYWVTSFASPVWAHACNYMLWPSTQFSKKLLKKATRPKTYRVGNQTHEVVPLSCWQCVPCGVASRCVEWPVLTTARAVPEWVGANWSNDQRWRFQVRAPLVRSLVVPGIVRNRFMSSFQERFDIRWKGNTGEPSNPRDRSFFWSVASVYCFTGHDGNDD